MLHTQSCWVFDKAALWAVVHCAVRKVAHDRFWIAPALVAIIAGATWSVDGTQSSDFMRLELEVKEIEVFFHVLDRVRGRDNSHASLDQKPQ